MSTATGGTPLRQLTNAGIEKALEFLAGLREDPAGDRTPPDELLYEEPYSRPFNEEIRVEPRTFRTRREAGEYLSLLLEPIRRSVIEDEGVWSWLGMFYFPHLVRVKNGRVQLNADETSLVAREGVEARRIYRHWLRGSWLLYEQHPDAAFLLDEDITSFGDLADRAFSDFRVFNSVGIVPLLIRLYTDGASTKRGFGHSPGGLRHLFRTLPQLELTYDVYGMEPDALLEVLPPAFREWA